MCFYDDDYDWIAEVSEQQFVRGDSQEKCDECGRQIAAGEWRRAVYQQEHEQCQVCEDDDSGNYISGNAEDYESDEEHAAALAKLAAHKHWYGETFSATICRGCCLILAAIYDLETKEGCPEDARQPPYLELSIVMHDDRRFEDGKYARHAVEMFPELAAHVLCAAGDK